MNLYEKEHKELHYKILNCKNDNCKPHLKGLGYNYCEDCQKAINDFLLEYGAGVLTNDLKIEELENKNSKLEKENKSLNQKLQEKTKRVEQLKQELSQRS